MHRPASKVASRTRRNTLSSSLWVWQLIRRCAQMQRIAAWTNLSETTFVLTPTVPEADYRLRIFTPKGELAFAGHPTLGSACAVIDARGGHWEAETILQECARGLIPVRLHAGNPRDLHLRLPGASFHELQADFASGLRAALGVDWMGIPCTVDVGPKWVIVQLESASAVRALVPDMAAIAALSGPAGLTGITIFGLEGQDVEVRSFAPSAGVPEDPVCGSGNGAVAVYRRRHGHSKDYTAHQGGCLGRAGRVEICYAPDGSVWLGGKTSICIEGKLQVE